MGQVLLIFLDIFNKLEVKNIKLQGNRRRKEIINSFSCKYTLRFSKVSYNMYNKTKNDSDLISVILISRILLFPSSSSEMRYDI